MNKSNNPDRLAFLESLATGLAAELRTLAVSEVRYRRLFEAALDGIVAASIYQGDHVDLYIDVPQASAARIHMRLSAREAAGLAGNGTKIGIGIGSEDLVAFPENRSQT